MRFSSFTAILSLVALGGVTFGSVVKRDNFANFFDDDNCQVNGGIGVDIFNDGCLGEAGRGSVFIPNVAFGFTRNMCLVKTRKDGSCSCQSVGFNFTPTGFCAVLDPEDESYRFINQACGPSNC